MMMIMIMTGEDVFQMVGILASVHAGTWMQRTWIRFLALANLVNFSLSHCSLSRLTVIVKKKNDEHVHDIKITEKSKPFD